MSLVVKSEDSKGNILLSFDMLNWYSLSMLVLFLSTILVLSSFNSVYQYSLAPSTDVNVLFLMAYALASLSMFVASYYNLMKSGRAIRLKLNAV